MKKPVCPFNYFAGTVRRFVRLALDSHRFFVKESPAFVGRIENGRWAMPWQARLFWPVAWMRFMCLMVHEGMRNAEMSGGR
jgi:hypothetical protein